MCVHWKVQWSRQNSSGCLWAGDATRQSMMVNEYELKFDHVVSFLPMSGRLPYTGWPLNWASKTRSRTILGLVVVALQLQWPRLPCPPNFSQPPTEKWVGKIVPYMLASSLFAGNQYLCYNHMYIYLYIYNYIFTFIYIYLHIYIYYIRCISLPFDVLVVLGASSAETCWGFLWEHVTMDTSLHSSTKDLYQH